MGHLDTRYAKRYLMSGQLNLARTLGSNSSEYDVSGAHQMTLGAWRVTGRAEFRSAEFRRQQPLTTDFGARLDRQLKSDLSAQRSFPIGASLSLSASQTKNLGTMPGDGIDETILSERLPSYNFSLQSHPVGRLPDEDGEGGRCPSWPPCATPSPPAEARNGWNRRTRPTPYPFSPRLGGPDSSSVDTTYAILKDRTSSATHRLNLSDTRRLLGASISPRGST